jgi:CheY-like chemotaxis protein
LILLAVQDASSRQAHADNLTAAGFELAEVVSTDEALSYLESRSDIRLIITDIDMLGCLTGLGLARFIYRRWPQIHIIILGWPVEPTPILPQTAGLLGRPCSPAALLEEVRRRLFAAE